MSSFTSARTRTVLALAFLLLALACADNGSQAVDSTRELVFEVPQDGATITEATRVSVAGEGIHKVLFVLDGETRFEDFGEPFEWVIEPHDFAAGAHFLVVQAETDLGVKSVQARISVVEPKYTLTVRGGTGGGEFAKDVVVDVEAGTAATGELFDRWTGDTAYLNSTTDASASVTMPAKDIEIVATYVARPGPEEPETSGSSWTRKIVSLENTTYTGNPFELEIDATFTHTASGTAIKLPGYYAGSDTWKVAFMPTKTGTWSWISSSTDTDLDGKSGSFQHNETGALGLLRGDPDHPKKWQLSGGAYVVPIALRCEFFCEPATTSEFTDVADFLEDHNILMLETRLLEENGLFDGRHDFIFDGNWKNHEFDLDIWDRMEERMNILAERGLGAHVMFYSDDGGEPGWDGKSTTEKLVIRYAIARLAAYPVVIFNTGIDIAEYRNQSEIDWFGDTVRDLDPYGHPVSSRRGGGSGSIAMADQLFDSHGDRKAEIGVLLSRYEDADDIPVSMDDAWGENRGSHSSKDHTAADIRRAFWKCVAAGGVGGLVRGGADGLSTTGYYLIESLESDLESEQWLKLVNPFVRDKLGETFGAMEPVSALATNGHAIADIDRTIILVVVIGKNDTYDGTAGGDVTVDLSGLSGSYTAKWFDPRSGSETSLDSLAAGKSHTLSPPTSDDWVLLLKKS